MEKTKLNKVSIRLINDAPLVSDEQLDTPKKAAKIVGDFIRNMDREVLCVVNFNSKLQPINFNVVSVGTFNPAAPRRPAGGWCPPAGPLWRGNRR